MCYDREYLKKISFLYVNESEVLWGHPYKNTVWLLVVL